MIETIIFIVGSVVCISTAIFALFCTLGIVMDAIEDLYHWLKYKIMGNYY